jgi:hypothetical protein
LGDVAPAQKLLDATSAMIGSLQDLVAIDMPMALNRSPDVGHQKMFFHGPMARNVCRA